MALNVAYEQNADFSFTVADCLYSLPRAIRTRVYEVQVLVLDYKTGRPATGREVEVMMPDAKGDIHNDSPRIFKKTGKNGIAVFPIGSPAPPQLWVVADFSCTRRRAFETSEVLQQGIAGDHADFELCKKPTSRTVTVQPGEIVVYTRRLNLWLRFQRFFWEVFES
jgi:hypothetical protein